MTAGQVDGKNEAQKITFTGCWTCRWRHVKCDERHPKCLRCERTGVDCRGYSIELSWVHEGSNPRRLIRRLTPVQRSWPVIDSEQVQADLTNLAAVHGMAQAGLFSVFSVNPTLQSSSTLDQAIVDEFDFDPLLSDPSFLDHLMDANNQTPWVESEIGTDQGANFSCYLQGLGSGSSSNGHAEVEGQLTPVEQTITEERYHVVAKDSNSDFQEKLKNSRSIPNTPNSIPTHLDILPRPSGQQRLLYHWVTHLSCALQPIAYVEDLLVSVCLPLAYEGLNNASDVSSGQLALFHAICSISAFNLGYITDNDATLIELGVKHQQLSQIHLRLNLSTKDPQESLAVLSTIVIYILDSSTNGTPHSWRHHIRGGDRILKNNPELWSSSRSASLIFQFFQFLKLFARLQQMTRDDQEFSVDLRSCDSAYLYDTMGISPALLRIMSTNQALFTTADTPRIDLDRIELELFLARVPPETDSTLQSQIKSYHSSIFYYAFLIYFKRSIRGGSANSQEIQDLAEKGAEYLLMLDQTSLKNPIVPITWPVIVIASETQVPEMRRRLRAWFAARKRYGFAAYGIAEELVELVWKSQEDRCEQGVKNWQDLYQSKPSYDVLLV